MVNQYTIKELSLLLGCSIPTTNNRLKKFDIAIKKAFVNGRSIAVVQIDDDTLKALKGALKDDKEDAQTSSSALNTEYIEKYFALKEEHLELKANIQLLEDKKKSEIEVYINEVNHLRNKIDDDAQTITNMKRIDKYKNIALYIIGCVLIICFTLLCTKLF